MLFVNKKGEIFQSTHPSWGATKKKLLTVMAIEYFNPRTHRGVRRESITIYTKEIEFQSTHPSWGATSYKPCQKFLQILFQSTHPSWGATKNAITTVSADKFQSTHPSWGATRGASGLLDEVNISIHAPIVGCDRTVARGSKSCLKFQSTHPSWGATFTKK